MKICLACGSEYQYSRSSGGGYKYCSSACNPNSSRKAIVEPRKCNGCDTIVVQDLKKRGGVQLFCSRKCMKTYHKQDRVKAKKYADKYRLSIHGRAKTLWSHAKYRAKRKGLEHTLDEQAIIDVLEKGRCEATNIEFVFQIPDVKNKHHPYSPSIDRIDSNLGYTPENCQIVVYAFNSIKNQWDMDIIHYVITQYFQHNINSFPDGNVFIQEDPLALE